MAFSHLNPYLADNQAANDRNATTPSFPEGDTLKWESIDRQKPSSAPLTRLAIFGELRPMAYSI